MQGVHVWVCMILMTNRSRCHHEEVTSPLHAVLLAVVPVCLVYMHSRQALTCPV